MTVQMEFWQLLTLLLAFFAFVAASAKVLLNQMERRLCERFAALEAARQIADNAMQSSLNRHVEEGQKEVTRLQALDRDFMQLKADLPLHYVRREDYVRGQTVLEAKMDALYLEVVHMKGQR